MILELDVEKKTVKIKGTIKVSELTAMLKEFGLDDYTLEQPIEYVESVNVPWIQTEPYTKSYNWDITCTDSDTISVLNLQSGTLDVTKNNFNTPFTYTNNC